MICNKLIRDLLPEIYAKQGKTCVTETLELEEFATYTKTKKYAEEVAKDKLGLVYENEIIFQEVD